ncbi:hypothetical protein ART_0505 [Arthrobacter sp. PAMC 25486]|nr:hypothetical protein ART_0505 [Arthrobacter sp. PAMC 25486]
MVMSYRLGFEGFGWVEGAPHNRGVLDWLLALEWVQRNIASFGGDPARVTIAGQSAGGGAVLTVLGLPSAQKLFSAVYCSSGVTADVTLNRSREFARKLAEQAGVAPTRTGFESVDEERLLGLQKKAAMPQGSPLKMLQSLAEEGLSLGPVMDGGLITQPTIEAIRSGVGADKPLVIGSNDDEFSMIFSDMKNKLKWIPAGFLLGRIGLRGTKRSDYLGANADVKARGTAAIMGRYLTDSVFRAFIPALVKARGTAPTWVYRFSWRSPVHDCAFDCLEVPFFFDLLDREGVTEIAGDAPPQKLADELHASALRFLSDGDPGWPHSGTTGTTRVWDVPSQEIGDGYQSVAALL